MAWPTDNLCGCMTLSAKDSLVCCLFFKPEELNLSGTGLFRYKYSSYGYNIASLPHGNAGELKQYKWSPCWTVLHTHIKNAWLLHTHKTKASIHRASPSPSQLLNGRQQFNASSFGLQIDDCNDLKATWTRNTFTQTSSTPTFYLN